MRITHGDGADFNLLATHIETIRISPRRRIERQIARFETGYAHVYRHDTPALHARVDEPGRAVHRDRTRARLPTPIEQGGDTARTVAALFDFAAVGIEDAIEDRGIRPSGLLQNQGLVETDAGAAVAELSELFRRRQGLPGGPIED